MNDSTVLVTTLPDQLLCGTEFDVRRTAGVLVQLVTEAKEELLIASPFITADDEYMGGESMYQSLVAATKRGVKLICFLSTSGAKDVLSNGLHRELHNLTLFEPSSALAAEKRMGSHAKVVIADSMSAYIGSANFTYPGLHSQLEIGVHVHGDIARECRCLWNIVQANGYFQQVFP
ncbi:phospholipase D-like domain-containing protein [Fimbriimonas ginsengisoli]|uniref:phospholipase D-like domain-containing protein n=1 Tax=Fimbriimonas ginsengisoli TaxID=1005039 RepID=UPI00046CB2AA|nr:phospholipase D-like domain-containing protein [Fimbriimonas ginsengisoli]